MADTDKGRIPNQKSKLGRLIYSRGLRVYDVCAATRIGYAQITRYTNLRQPIAPDHLRRMSLFFDVEPEDLIGT